MNAWRGGDRQNLENNFVRTRRGDVARLSVHAVFGDKNFGHIKFPYEWQNSSKLWDANNDGSHMTGDGYMHIEAMLY
jgi:hypothetical protein